jgi:hypothetical protein
MPKAPPAHPPTLIAQMSLLQGQPKRARRTLAERKPERADLISKAEREASLGLSQSQPDE